MPNEFQDLESGKGILKDYYPDAEKKSRTQAALRKKRKKLEESKLVMSDEDRKQRELAKKPY